MSRMLDFDTETRIPFGKYRDCKLSDADTGYLQWVLSKAASGDCFEVVSRFVFEHSQEIHNAINRTERSQLDAGLASHPIALTDHQREVSNQTYDALFDKGIARLQGGAGYGKSYTATDLAIRLRKSGHKVQAAATSYVATQVLAQQFDPYGIKTGTLAKTLRLNKIYDGPVEKYLLTGDSEIAVQEIFSDEGCLIVDEDSMVDDILANFLISSAEIHGGQLLTVGDAKQLPPVKQNHPSMFVLSDYIEGGELTQPMRYSKESSLYQLEQQAARNPFSISTDKIAFEIPDGKLGTYASTAELLESAAQGIKDAPNALHRVLFFRRKEVVSANAYIRGAIFGENAAVVEPDEELLVLATTDIQDGPGKEDSTRYYSGTRKRVIATREGNTRGIPHFEVLFKGHPLWTPIMFAVTENQMDLTKLGGKEYTEALRLEAERVKSMKVPDWSDYITLKKLFVPVGYSYATTVHRSQGQTVDYAYVDPWQFSKLPALMGRALAYVAMTRAKERLSITQNPYL